MQNILDPYVITWEKHNINKPFGCAWPSMKLPEGDHAEVTPILPSLFHIMIFDIIILYEN